MLRLLVLVVLVMAIAIGPATLGAASPAGTAFTYQGHLEQGGFPAEGTFNFGFGLFDAVSGGSQIGDLVARSATVTGGVFTTQLDFGSSAFVGEARWLEISVNGTTLNPRQPITSAPYSLHALDGATASDLVILQAKVSALSAQIDQIQFRLPVPILASVGTPVNEIRTLAINPVSHLVYAVGQQGRGAIIDGSTDTLLPQTFTGDQYSGVAVNPSTNTVYAGGPNQLWVSNGATGQLITGITVPSQPGGIAVNSLSNVIYVGCADQVVVVDGSSNVVVTTVAVPGLFTGPGASTSNIAFDSSTNHVYVATYQALTVIDGVTNSVITTLPVILDHITVNASTHRLYGVSKLRDGTTTGIVVIDTGSNTLLQPIPLLQPGGTFVIAANPTSRLYVFANDQLSIIDLASGVRSVPQSIPGSGFPYSMALDTSTNTLYIGKGSSVDVIR